MPAPNIHNPKLIKMNIIIHIGNIFEQINRTLPYFIATFIETRDNISIIGIVCYFVVFYLQAGLVYFQGNTCYLYFWMHSIILISIFIIRQLIDISDIENIFIIQYIYLDMQEKTPSGDEMEFNRQFSTFNLMATYSNGKLNVKLFDYIDWIVYQKQFSQTNIGVQIHKKVDLEDLYFSLAFTKDSQSQLREKIQIPDYVFGNTVKNGERLCFKIQKGGKITVYTPGIDSKTGKQIYHQSNLNLKQARSMTEMQILSQKMLGQKREHAKKFQIQLEQLQIQCNRMKTNMKKIEQQNINLIQQLQNTKYQLSAIKEQQMRTNDQIKINNLELRKEYKDLLNKMESLAQQNNKFKQCIMYQMKKNSDLYNKQLNTFETRYKQIGEFVSKMSITKLKQPYYNKFNVNHSEYQIKYTGQVAWTHYILNDKIQFNTPYTFKIKIVSTTARNIMIGVTDYSKQKDQRSSYASVNAICYAGNNGYIYGLGSVEGAGFSAGQTVQINVNLAAKSIKWLVGGTQRASCTLDMLADQSRVFMPFIQMVNVNDTVQVCFD